MIGSLVRRVRRRVGARLALRACALLALTFAVTSMGTVAILRESMSRALEDATAFAEDADLVVQARGGATVEEGVLAEIRDADGVAAAAPVLHRPISAAGRTAVLLGIDEQIAAVSPAAAGAVEAAVASGGPGLTGVWVVAGGPFDGVPTLVVGEGEEEVPVSGTFDRGSLAAVLDETTVVAALPVAQMLAGAEGGLDLVLVRTDPSAATEQVRSALVAAAGPSVDVARAEATGSGLAGIARPFEEGLLLMAVLAGFVAAVVMFQVANLFASENATAVRVVRALGMSRREAAWWVVRPILILSVLGVALGLVGAVVVGRYTVDNIPSRYVDTLGLSVPFRVPPAGLALAGIAGLVTAGFGTVTAGRAVLRIEPFAGQIVPDPRIRWRPLVVRAGLGSVLIAISAVTATGEWSAPVVSLLLLNVGLLLWATALAGPLVAGVARVLALGGSTLQLIGTGLRHAPGRVIATMTAIAIVGSSFIAQAGINRDTSRATEASWSRFESERVLVTAGSGTDLAPLARLAPELVAELEEVDGVVAAEPQLASLVTIGDTEVLLTGTSSDDVAPLTGLDRRERARFDAGEGVVVSRTLATEEGIEVGATIELPTAAGSADRPVVAVVPHLTWEGGAVTAPYDDVVEWTSSPGPTSIEVVTREGAEAEVAVAARRLLADHPGPGTVVLGPDVVADAVAANEQLSAVSQGMRIALAFSAVTVLPATIAITALERRRVLAVLRAMGATRPRVAAVVTGEALVAATVGVVMGVLTGYATQAQVLAAWGDGVTDVSFSAGVGETARIVAVIVVAAVATCCVPVLAAVRSRVVVSAEGE